MFPLVHNLFAEKFLSDRREPILSVSLKGLGVFGIVALPVLFWFQLATLLFLESLINGLIAVVVYRYVIQQQHGYLSATILTYGALLPFALVTPFQLVKFLDVRNTALMLGLGGPQLITLFRCIEAINGTSPAFATISLRNFILYFLSPVQFNFDPGTQKVLPSTKAELMHKLKRVISLSIQVIASFSILAPVSYKPFVESERGYFTGFFSFGHLCNNYVAAYLTGVCVESGSMVVALFLSLVSGYSTMELNDHPLSASLSVAEFWGKRWNRMVGGLLKRAVYEPMRRSSFSVPVSAVATFLMSGLLHEYVLLLLATKAVMVDDDSFTIRFGSQFMFFVWNGMMLVLESSFKRTNASMWMYKTLPNPIITMLVLLTVLPVSHWFTDEYLNAGLYDDFSQAFPRIVKIKGT